MWIEVVYWVLVMLTGWLEVKLLMERWSGGFFLKLLFARFLWGRVGTSHWGLNIEVFGSGKRLRGIRIFLLMRLGRVAILICQGQGLGFQQICHLRGNVFERIILGVGRLVHLMIMGFEGFGRFNFASWYQCNWNEQWHSDYRNYHFPLLFHLTYKTQKPIYFFLY